MKIEVGLAMFSFLFHRFFSTTSLSDGYLRDDKSFMDPIYSSIDLLAAQQAVARVNRGMELSRLGGTFLFSALFPSSVTGVYQ